MYIYICCPNGVLDSSVAFSETMALDLQVKKSIRGSLAKFVLRDLLRHDTIHKSKRKCSRNARFAFFYLGNQHFFLYGSVGKFVRCETH